MKRVPIPTGRMTFVFLIVLAFVLLACDLNSLLSQANAPAASSTSEGSAENLPTQSAASPSPGASATVVAAKGTTPTAAAPTQAAAKTQTVNPQAASGYDKLLTATDVEKVTGLKGVKLVAYNPSKGAGGDLNFALQDDSLVLMAQFWGASTYDKAKQQKGYVKEQVSGIGDDAFSGPTDDTNMLKPPKGPAEPYIFGFRKGAQSAVLATFMNMSTFKLYISQAQLRELGKLIASRM